MSNTQAHLFDRVVVPMGGTLCVALFLLSIYLNL